MESLFFLLVILMAAWLAFGLWQRLRRRTRYRGSRYYVPTFRAHFDTWQSKWTMSRRWTEDREKARWQQDFDRCE